MDEWTARLKQLKRAIEQIETTNDDLARRCADLERRIAELAPHGDRER